jgi:hypothetical protein
MGLLAIFSWERHMGCYDGEAHFKEMLARDPGFRRIHEERRPRREPGRLVLERRLELGLSQREPAERVGTSQNRILIVKTATPTRRWTPCGGLPRCWASL